MLTPCHFSFRHAIFAVYSLLPLLSLFRLTPQRCAPLRHADIIFLSFSLFCRHDTGFLSPLRCHCLFAAIIAEHASAPCRYYDIIAIAADAFRHFRWLFAAFIDIYAFAFRLFFAAVTPRAAADDAERHAAFSLFH